MLGLDYLYVLVRFNEQCFKVGISSNLDHRLKSLMQGFGPFSIEKSFLVRMDHRQDVEALEEGVKRLFESYRFKMPKLTNRRNGETEWYLMDCYVDLKGWVEDFAKRKGEIVRQMNLSWMLSSEQQDHALVDKLEALLLQQAEQLKALSANAAGEKEIRQFLRNATPSLIGVAEIHKETHLEYEIYLSPDCCDTDKLNELLKVSVCAQDEDFLAVSTVCSEVSGTREYKRLRLAIPGNSMRIANRNTFEGRWEAERFVKSYAAALRGLARLYPLPPAFQKYVGRSFWDDLSDAEKHDLGDQLWLALLGAGGRATP